MLTSTGVPPRGGEWECRLGTEASRTCRALCCLAGGEPRAGLVACGLFPTTGSEASRLQVKWGGLPLLGQ